VVHIRYVYCTCFRSRVLTRSCRLEASSRARVAFSTTARTYRTRQQHSAATQHKRALHSQPFAGRPAAAASLVDLQGQRAAAASCHFLLQSTHERPKQLPDPPAPLAPPRRCTVLAEAPPPTTVPSAPDLTARGPRLRSRRPAEAAGSTTPCADSPASPPRCPSAAGGRAATRCPRHQPTCSVHVTCVTCVACVTCVTRV
jgi:hypothetical protein